MEIKPFIDEKKDDKNDKTSRLTTKEREKRPSLLKIQPQNKTVI